MTDWNAMSDAEFRKEVRGFLRPSTPRSCATCRTDPNFARSNPGTASCTPEAGSRRLGLRNMAAWG